MEYVHSKRIIFILAACICLIGCKNQPKTKTIGTFEACHASEDTIPTFLEKYDSITDGNLDTFISDWYEYSRAIVNSYVPEYTTNKLCMTEFNEVHQNVAYEYKFIVLPLHVNVYYFDKALNMLDITSGSYLWRKCKFYYWYCFKDKDKDVIFYNSHDIWKEKYQKGFLTPVLSGQDSVLYLTDAIYDKLASYLGGLRIGEINEGRFAPINQQHVDILKERNYFEFKQGHWGGYWHLETMPITEYISFFRNGAIVSARKSFCITDEYWYELKGSNYKRHHEPVGGWIE